MIEHKGVNYDVGTVMGGIWRPYYHPQTVERELEIIKDDLYCNVVGISGKDLGGVVTTAEAAFNQGLEAWLNPADWTNIPPEPTDSPILPKPPRRLSHYMNATPVRSY